MGTPDAIRELVRRFEEHREAYQSGRYNETQLRREFLDPFFEALGWDVNNRQSHAEAYKEVIHEDAVKVGGLTKAPDYSFRIGGARKFFVEAKKPSISIKNDPGPAFQLRRYAWSAKLPLSILTDFDELAVYDCRRRPDKADKSSLGRVIYLTCAEFDARWEEIAGIFAKESILKGSFDRFAIAGAGAKRGTAGVDAAFLAEIEGWRDLLARSIALRNPDLSVEELNFAVQRTIDRIIFLRICEDRGIEDYGSLLALVNGENTYGRLRELYRRADERYNSGLFHFRSEKDRAEHPDTLTPRLAIDDKPLKEIIRGLYYPDSPYEFSVLPADILGQVYEQFLGKVIRLTAGHRAVVEEKPEVKKAGGVYYTPTYIVDYIVKSTVGKLLEGENEGTLARQLRMFHERALPDLGKNIKCGNSLIGPDWNDGKQLDLLSGGDQARVNSFDWPAEFPDVIARSEATRQSDANSGFDAVIGNPPYVRIQTLKESAPLEVEYYKQRYRAAGKGNYDIYVVFVERGLELLNPKGRLGFILPHKFFNAQYGEPLRRLIAEGKHLADVVHFGDRQVFQGATTYTCLMFLDKTGSASLGFTQVQDLDAWRREGTTVTGKIPAKNISAADWNFNVGRGAGLFGRLRAMPVKLKNVAERMAQGIRTSANEVFVLDLVQSEGEILKVHSKILDRNVRIERGAVSLFLQGREIKPYRISPSGKVVIVPYTTATTRPALIEEDEIGKRFPLLHAYLTLNKNFLAEREKGRMRGSNWYAYIYPKNLEVMRCPKILVPDIADRASFAFDEAGEYAFTSGYGITIAPGIRESVKYLLGLLNSRLLDHYLKSISTTMRGGFFRYFTQYLSQLPIRTIDFSNPTDKRRHDEMVALVERMLDLHKKLPAARTDQEKTAHQRQIADTDRRIDRLVYDLYGLTEKEIQIVEGSQ